MPYKDPQKRKDSAREHGRRYKQRQHDTKFGVTAGDITEIIETKRVSNGKLDDLLRFESVLVLEKP